MVTLHSTQRIDHPVEKLPGPDLLPIQAFGAGKVDDGRGFKGYRAEPGLDGFRGIGDQVMVFVFRFDVVQDLHGLLGRGRVDDDLLETTLQGTVLLGLWIAGMVRVPLLRFLA